MKPVKAPKETVAPKAQSMKKKCVQSRAYKAAFKVAKDAGESHEVQCEKGTLAFRKAGVEWLPLPALGE